MTPATTTTTPSAVNAFALSAASQAVYDALAEHATTAELAAIRQDRRWVLLALGGVMALLTGVPLLGLLAPSIAALAYIHFCLEALRRQRQAAPAASGKS